MGQTKVYVPLTSKGNAIHALNELDERGVSNISIIVYDVAGNHLVAASDDPRELGGPRGVEEKYKLSSDAVSAIRRDSRNGSIAVLAYSNYGNEVYLLDSVRDPMAASALMVVVANALLQGIMKKCGHQSHVPTREPYREVRNVPSNNSGRYDDLIPNFSTAVYSSDGMPLPSIM